MRRVKSTVCVYIQLKYVYKICLNLDPDIKFKQASETISLLDLLLVES